MKSLQTIQLLLVENNPGDAQLIREILRDAPIKVDVEVAATLKSGFGKLEERRFDAVLLDLSLPDSQGLETVSRVHQQAPELPILVLTGVNDENMALQAVREGAQDSLVKESMDGALLLRAIRYAIERNRMQSALRALSLLDELTGIYNRRGFMTLAEHQMKLSRRRLVGFYLIFIDLDGMKAINDTYGHAAGDKTLMATAQLLSDTFRGSDVVARMGGDEFAVVTTESNGHGSAPIITRLEAAVCHHNCMHSEDPPLSFSCGAVYFDPEQDIPLETLLEEADKIMYDNKRAKYANR